MGDTDVRPLHRQQHLTEGNSSYRYNSQFLVVRQKTLIHKKRVIYNHSLRVSFSKGGLEDFLGVPTTAIKFILSCLSAHSKLSVTLKKHLVPSPPSTL